MALPSPGAGTVLNPKPYAVEGSNEALPFKF